MKKIKILSILMLIVIAFACDNDYETPFSFSDVVWKISETPNDTMFVLAQDDYITFVDLSQGALSHEWRLDEGCLQLSPDFTKNDSVYTEFIMPNAGNVATDGISHVIFTEPGLKTVQLYNTYSDSVAFITADEDTIPAVQQGDIWVIDTTFVVDVYAHIQPAFKVFFGEELKLDITADMMPDESERATWDTVTVEVGQELTYVDMTTIGRPNRRTWSLDGGVPAESNDSASVIAFFKMGIATGSVDVSRAGDLPKGSTSKLIPLIVKVVQSSQPFEFAGKAKELANGNIGFNVSGEVADFSGREGDFTVHVKNEGFEADIAVSSAKVNSSDATMIELTLAEEIYNTDDVLISYNGDAILSLDERVLQGFSDKLVTMEIGNSVTNSSVMGFEDFKDNFKAANANGWWVGKVNDNYLRTEDISGSGLACMRYVSSGGVTNKKVYATKFLATGAAAPAGPYIEKIKVYVDEATTMTAFKTYMVTPSNVTTWDISEVEKGTWVTLSKVVNFTAQPSAKYGINITSADNPDATGDQLIYFDDMELIPLEARPMP